ncbi:MAG: SPOR domain-containing protein [Deltaproteobacteria bacterium]|nr:SPOR domain-containing protein [Deltaproteobacteria bacterium]
MIISRISQVFFVALGLLVGACALLDDGPAKKPAATGLIATPPTYYSTAKARYLGAKYKDNLDRLVERITRNSKTAPLQFANNISSVGGIGFFTHSATKTADERYLEVVLAAPDTFEIRGEHSEKVQRLFSRYGLELLGILNGDSDIYQDQELNGYGLNLAWRNVVADKAGNRVMLERAIIYFRKERVRNFIRQEIKQNDLLADAVIFAVEEDGPLNLVSFRPQEVRQDFRPAIQEDNLAAHVYDETSLKTLTGCPFAIPRPVASSGFSITEGSPRCVCNIIWLTALPEWMVQRACPLVIVKGWFPPCLGLSLCTGSCSPASRNHS